MGKYGGFATQHSVQVKCIRALQAVHIVRKKHPAVTEKSLEGGRGAYSAIWRILSYTLSADTT